MKRFSGFSLIELMVVIAILAILASLLFPALGRARKEAYKAVCSNNNSQHGKAVSQYSSDNGGRYAAHYFGGGQNASLWFGKTGTEENTPATSKPLNIYLGLDDNESEAPFAQCTSETVELNGYNGQGSSYHRNQTSLVRGWSKDDFTPIKTTMLVQPSKFLFGGERGGLVAFRNPNRMSDSKYYYHTNELRFVYLYGDGHVSFTKIGLNKPNTDNYMWDNE